MGTITALVLLSVLILQPAVNQENILTALRVSSATTAVPFLLLFALTPFDRPGSAVHTWLTNHGAEDWREAFQAAHPEVPDWFATAGVDLSDRLASLPIPTLLLWGDADPISPVAVGRRLAALLPAARLVVLPGGSHDLATERAAEIAPLIERHLASLPMHA